MKIRPLLLASALAFGFASSTNAQTARPGCSTERFMQDMEQNFPEMANDRAILERQIQQYISQQAKQQKVTGTVIKIPVVIHVVTQTGCNGVSKAQILNGLEVLNKNFRRQNADTANTRAIFRSVAADTEIEFVLARKDPSGMTSDGINRVSSAKTNAPYNRDDVKTAAPGWPADKYFNIWLVDKIYDASTNSNIAGYAQFPIANLWNTYGVVLVHNQWGQQGAVSGSTAISDGDIATHEIAHCLHLFHVEGNDCSNTDQVADTPPSDLTLISNFCDPNQNTCTNDPAVSSYTTDVPDQFENFVSYSTCQNMFTKGQKARMQATLNTVPQLQNLISATNAAVTGIDPSSMIGMGGGLPMPYFCTGSKQVCAGTTITFEDRSFNAPATALSWSFGGGTPATSNSQNPVITYNTPGKYNVQLTSTNAEGQRTTIWTDYITVVPVNNLINISPPNYYVEGFEEATFPVSATQNRNWEKSTSSLAANPENWTKVSNAYSNITNSSGTNSVRLQNAALAAGTVSTLVTPNFSVPAGFPGAVFMEMAYAKKNSQPKEELRVYYSDDCGATWNGPIKTLTGDQLVTNGGAVVSNFVPVTGEWRIIPITNGGAIFLNAPHIMFKIDVTSNSGGNLYIDNFTIGSVLDTKEDIIAQHAIKVSPNPLTLETGINFELRTSEKVAVKILDLAGRTVHENKATTFSAGSHTISLADKMQSLKAGMYMVQLDLGGKIATTKLLVQ